MQEEPLYAPKCGQFSDTNRMHTTSYLRIQLLAEAVFSTIAPSFEMFFGALDVSLHMRSEWAGPI